MPGYEKFTKEVGDRVVDAMTPVQDLTVELISSVSETVESIVPEIHLPEFVPTTKEVVNSSFDLVEKLLGAQRAYIGRVLDAVAPVMGKFEPKPARPRAAKSTAA